MTCPCHGEPWRITGEKRQCVVKHREAQKRYARKARKTVAYAVTQRRGRLRRMRAQTLVELGQLTEEGHEWRLAATPATNGS